MVQQYVIEMLSAKIPQEVINALVNLDTMVKMVKTVFEKVGIACNPINCVENTPLGVSLLMYILLYS